MDRQKKPSKSGGEERERITGKEEIERKVSGGWVTNHLFGLAINETHIMGLCRPRHNLWCEKEREKRETTDTQHVAQWKYGRKERERVNHRKRGR